MEFLTADAPERGIAIEEEAEVGTEICDHGRVLTVVESFEKHYEVAMPGGETDHIAKWQVPPCPRCDKHVLIDRAIAPFVTEVHCRNCQRQTGAAI